MCTRTNVFRGGVASSTSLDGISDGKNRTEEQYVSPGVGHVFELLKAVPVSEQVIHLVDSYS